MFYQTDTPHGLPHDPFKALIAAPRVADSPASLECRHWQSVELPTREGEDMGYTMIIGFVIGIFINDDYITDGLVDIAKIQPIARMGYMDYAKVGFDNIFSLKRPVIDKSKLA